MTAFPLSVFPVDFYLESHRKAQDLPSIRYTMVQAHSYFYLTGDMEIRQTAPHLT